MCARAGGEQATGAGGCRERPGSANMGEVSGRRDGPRVGAASHDRSGDTRAKSALERLSADRQPKSWPVSARWRHEATSAPRSWPGKRASNGGRERPKRAAAQTAAQEVRHLA